ncbi:MAG: hypothetical protein AAB777_02205 [Patescibacteria group bacterium]
MNTISSFDGKQHFFKMPQDLDPREQQLLDQEAAKLDQAIMEDTSGQVIITLDANSGANEKIAKDLLHLAEMAGYSASYTPLPGGKWLVGVVTGEVAA